MMNLGWTILTRSFIEKQIF